jgi:hypothetical protein
MVDPEHLILPGQSIGLVHVGDSLRRAIAVWGKPLSHEQGVYVTPYLTRYGWVRPIGVGKQATLLFADVCVQKCGNPPDMILALETMDPSFQTPEGIRPLLSTMDQVRAAYGPPESQRVLGGASDPTLRWLYPHRGMNINVRL